MLCHVVDCLLAVDSFLPPMPDSPQLKKRKMSPVETKLAPVFNLLIKRLSDKAKIPTRGSPLSAGYDLYRFDAFSHNRRVLFIHYHLSAEKKIIPAHGKALVDTQISIAVPAGTYGRVAPRSGLGASYHTRSRPDTYQYIQQLLNS